MPYAQTTIGFHVPLMIAISMLAGLPTELRADDPIEAARKILYTNRGESIVILEEAVRKSPERIDYWVELIRCLDVDSEDFVADLTSLAALERHPRSGELWQARAALLEPGAALEAISNLEKIPGYEEQSRDARQLLELGLNVPFSWSQPYSYGPWAAKLIDKGDWKKADEIANRGLKGFPKDKMLHACRAIILAQRGEFNAALSAQKTAGFPAMLGHPSSNWGLGDLLLTKGRADLAVKSFGDSIPEGPHREKERLILAHAFLSTDNVARADKVLEKCPSQAAKLLHVADLVQRKKLAEARGLRGELIPFLNDPDEAEGKVRPFMMRRFPPLSAQSWPPSLRRSLSAAVAWLEKEYPEERKEIEAQLGRSADYLKAKPTQEVKVLTTSEQLAELERTLQTADAREQWSLRNRLTRTLREAGRYDEAAAASVANALAEMPREYRLGLRIKSAAVEWSLCKRRAETVRYFAEHPERIAVARGTIYNVRGPRWNYGKVLGRAWLSEEEVIDRLTKMGPGILALVFDALEPNTISGRDRTVFVRVVENVGGEQDVPLLIDLLGLIVQSSEERDPNDRFQVENNRRDSLSEAALHRALEKLTKTTNTGESREDRVKFWQTWWDTNARRILTSPVGQAPPDAN